MILLADVPPINLFAYWSNYIDGMIDGFAPGLGPIVKLFTAPWSEEAAIADRIPNDVFRSLAGLEAGYSKRINELKKAREKPFKITSSVLLIRI